MELRKGAHLMVRASGELVKSLHDELKLLGYEVSSDEVERSFYGQNTKDQVARFQSDNGLSKTSIVDKPTAAKLGEMVAAK